MSRKRRALLLFFGSAFIVSFMLQSCLTFREHPKTIKRYFELKHVAAEVSSFDTRGRTMHYVASGNPSKPMVFFVHGSPGSLSAFLSYLADSTLLQKSYLVTADRPGFGYSNFGYAEPSLRIQGEILEELIVRKKANKPVILVGHSLGGPLIVQMAAENPGLIDGLIIIAGSLDPALEPNEMWFRAPLATPFLSWILPRSMRASNDELYQLEPQLEQMIPRYKEVTCPVIVIHGKKDRLVPYANAEFAQRMLVNSNVKILTDDDADHFIPWSHPAMVNRAILEMLDEVSVKQVAASTPVD